MSEKWKVFATDTYDYDQWQIGEYDTEDQARTIAINKASEMLRTDVEGPNGKRIGSYQGKQTTPPPLIEQLRATVVEQSQEIGRLRVLVINAYAEGGNHATLSLAQVSPNPTIIDYWMTSKTRAALQPKEEK